MSWADRINTSPDIDMPDIETRLALSAAWATTGGKITVDVQKPHVS
jgi:hypothetical protein